MVFPMPTAEDNVVSAGIVFPGVQEKMDRSALLREFIGVRNKRHGDPGDKGIEITIVEGEVRTHGYWKACLIRKNPSRHIGISQRVHGNIPTVITIVATDISAIPSHPH